MKAKSVPSVTFSVEVQMAAVASTTARAIDDSRSTTGSKGVQDDRLHVEFAVALVTALKFRVCRALARERLHDAHARDVLRKSRGHQAQSLADCAVRSGRAGGKITVAMPMSGMTASVARASRQSRTKRRIAVPMSVRLFCTRLVTAVRHQLVDRLDVVRQALMIRLRGCARKNPRERPLEMPEEADAQVPPGCARRPTP